MEKVDGQSGEYITKVDSQNGHRAESEVGPQTARTDGGWRGQTTNKLLNFQQT